MNISEELWVTLLSFALLLVPVVIVSGVIWGRYMRGRSSASPTHARRSWALWRILDRWFPWRQWLPTWSGQQVLWCMFLYVAIPALTYSLIQYALDVQNLEMDNTIHISLATVLACPATVCIWLLMLNRTNGTQLFQLGIHTHRWAQSLLTGLLAWVIIAPLVLAIHYTTIVVYLNYVGATPEDHILTRLMRGEYPVVEWFLLLSSALLVAPILEELFFRNIIQRWALMFKWRTHLVMVSALGVGLFLQSGDNGNGFAVFGFWLVLLPAYVMLPGVLPRGRSGYLLWRLTEEAPSGEEERMSAEVPREVSAETRFTREPIQLESTGWNVIPERTEEEDPPIVAPGLYSGVLALFDPLMEDLHANRVRGIIATATLFAVVHKWPFPVPLFALGLALGWLAYRTQSLITTLVFHLLFNAIPCVMIALTWLVPSFQTVTPK